MTKLDDLGGRAAAHLRDAVSDHLEAHPAPVPRTPRVPRAAVAAGLVVLSLGAALIVNASGPATRLQTADTPETPDARAPEESGHVVADPDPSGPAGRPPGGGNGSAPVSADRPGASPTVPPTSPPTTTDDSDGRTDPGNEPPSEEGEVFGVCDGSVSAGDVSEYDEWCVDGNNDNPTAEGHPLVVIVCRDARADDSTLHFDRRQEADFMVLDEAGREVWRWTRTRPVVPHPHERLVKAGGCVSWRVVWDERDQAGNKVPAASYQLRVTVLADEMHGRWKHVDQRIPVRRT